MNVVLMSSISKSSMSWSVSQKCIDKEQENSDRDDNKRNAQQFEDGAQSDVDQSIDDGNDNSSAKAMNIKTGQAFSEQENYHG